MTYLTDTWTTYNKKLDDIKLESISDIEKSKVLGGCMILPLSLNTTLMNTEIDLLEKFIQIDNFSILELGAGFGNYCKVLHEKANIKKYTILDTPSMLRFSKFYLNAFNIPCTFIESDKYEEIGNETFDLFISNICLSEIPTEFLESLLAFVLPKCDKLAVIDDRNSPFRDWFLSFVDSLKHFSHRVCYYLDGFYLRNHNIYIMRK